MKKRILTYLLALLAVLTMLVPAWADQTEDDLFIYDTVGLLDEDEAQGAGRVLKAAAMTYVAALLTSLLQLLLRFLLIFLGRGGGDRRGGRR